MCENKTCNLWPTEIWQNGKKTHKKKLQVISWLPWPWKKLDNSQFTALISQSKAAAEKEIDGVKVQNTTGVLHVAGE